MLRANGGSSLPPRKLKPGEFSIAVSLLTAEGGKTRLKFDHRGVPQWHMATRSLTAGIRITGSRSRNFLAQAKGRAHAIAQVAAR